MSEQRLQAEIRRLEARFAASPGGRAFAPLADLYRKDGRLQEALDLVREGLEQHPGYSSAHVILAKTLEDLARDSEAEQSWARVLELDPHNLLALRQLAHAALAAGDTNRARVLFGRLLAADPGNSEAEERLAALDGDVAMPAPEPASPEPVEEVVEEPAAEATPAPGPAPDRGPDPAPAGTAPASDGGELATLTLAGIYEEQGHGAKALRIYREVLRRNPERVELRERIERLEAEAGEPAPQKAAETTLDELEDRPAPPPSRPAKPREGTTGPVPSGPAGEEAGDEALPGDFDHFRKWLGRIKVEDS